MMKKILVSLFLLLTVTLVNAQDKKQYYNEDLNGMEQIDQAIAQAKSEGKNVLCQVGGNWCPWCIRFADFIGADEEIKKIVDDNFVYIHVNYSKKNRNHEAMKRLGNCTRFGFPVLVVLNDEGNVVHIQDSGLLEEGEGYSKKKVQSFFTHWTPKAIRGEK